MARSLALGIEHRQQQALSPRLLRAVRLLQLSSLDFSREVHDALGKNPFLEADESGRSDGTPADEAASPGSAEMALSATPAEDLQESRQSAESGEQDGATGDASDDLDGERERWQADGLPGKRSNDERGANGMDMRAGQESLSEHLLSQLRLLPLSACDLALAETIVGSLDDDGYLRVLLSDLIGIVDLTPPPGEDGLRIALARVQSLDPAGIGARSIQECLRLQLPAIDCVRQRGLARLIIDEHLDALVARDVPGLARALSRTSAEIQSALDCIRRFDPRPGWRFEASPVRYVTPDVIVRKEHGNWTAMLNPAIVPKVRLNHVYVEMFQRQHCAQHAELAAHLQEARWTVSNIEQRFATILGVSRAIVGRQRHFLEYGVLAMKPLGLREIAGEVGLHESTVSRVTNNKFMATPLGTFELKYFFSRAMPTASGGKCSATAIRGLIKDMIAAECPHAPLSDADITRQLARQGLVVARRTVTKYRQLLRIETFERRRQHV